MIREEAADEPMPETTQVPYRFRTAAELLDIGARTGLSIPEIVLANETALRPEPEVISHLGRVTSVMMACIDRGMAGEGELPGRLRVRRRAAGLRAQLEADHGRNARLPHEPMEWVSLFAIAVNEENASGSRVVTAPTNGAAGVIPAVLRYYRDLCHGASETRHARLPPRRHRPSAPSAR